MKDDEEIFQANLERCSYRFLQQTAKAMGLPSNVKKVYLIQLINAKNYCTQKDLDLLVRQVRQEQQQLALVRRKTNKNRRKKNAQQSPEISSTSNGLSPPITGTPKRVSHIFIRYSPEIHSPIKYPRAMPSRRNPISSSDRVLRSSNRVKKPSYLLNNTLMSLLKVSDAEERSETKVIISNKEEHNRKVNRIYAKKIIDDWKNGGEVAAVVPVSRSVNISSPQPCTVQRRLSGVYPLQPEDIKLPNVAVRRADGSITKLKAIIQKPLSQHNYNNDRQTDNRNQSLLKGNEITLTPPNMTEIAQNSSYRSSNLSEITPSLVYMPSNTIEMATSMNYRPSNMATTPNLGSSTPSMFEIPQNMGHRTTNITEISPGYSYRAQNNSLPEIPQNSFSFSSSSEEINLSNTKDNHSRQYAEYYHKKIRAEQVRSLRRSREMARSVENECRLPKINEVFSKFNGVYNRDVTRPLYVQVDGESVIAPNPPYIPDLPYIPDPRVQYQSNGTLEKIYNLKTASQQPILQICTTTNTHTVYCTPVISTVKAQPSSTAVLSVYNVASPQRDSQSFFMNDDEEIPRAHDFFSNFHYHEQNMNGASTLDFQRSCSSIETLTSQEQELGANVTIPEMVEDALEIISQDGDYMERMGMDIRMQCILCNWAGPKIILEYHIRKDHSSEIVQCESNEWCAKYTLGGLASRHLWLSQVLEHNGALYVLSAKYEDPDCFMAALSTISHDPDDRKTGSMTMYNKVTGEPFTWTGVVTDLPPCMPYENDPNCFRLQLSRMDLLPNSANLKLLNRELVIRSPTKVVVGQPELDNIHISLIVKIID